MPKNKIRKFAQIETYPNLIQYAFNEAEKVLSPFVKRQNERIEIKGKWNHLVFKNNNPIVLELACGKGHYTLELARRFPEKNFIGVDIRGERLWEGAKTALDEGLKNTAFLRTQIEFIDQFFIKNEVDEIWITFPDPFPKNRHIKKRLTSPGFIELYKNILPDHGEIHLKTDATSLFEYTIETVVEHGYKLKDVIFDVYDRFQDESHILVDVKTFYEKLFTEKGERIKYLKFMINN